MPEINLDLVRDRNTIEIEHTDNSTTFEEFDNICDEAYSHDPDEQRALSIEPQAWRKNFAPSISSIYSDSSSFMNARPRGSFAPSDLRVSVAAPGAPTQVDESQT